MTKISPDLLDESFWDIKKVEWKYDYDGNIFELHQANGTIACCWIPKEVHPWGILIYMHGLNSNIGLNANTLRDFTQCGLITIASDHLGHGKSPGLRSLTTIENIHLEISSLIEWAASNFIKLPIYLYGHSLGGLSVISYILSRPRDQRISAVITTGPWLSTRALPNPGKKEEKILKFFSDHFPAFNIPLPPDSSKYDPGFIQMRSEHPVFQGINPITVRSAFYTMYNVINNPNLWPKDLPFLLGQGLGDKLVSIPTNRNFAKAVKENIGNNMKYIEYPNGLHDLLKTAERAPWMVECLTFMSSHVKHE